MAAGLDIGVRRALLATAVLAVLLGLVGMHQLATTATSHSGVGVEQVGVEHGMPAEQDGRSGLPAPIEPQPRDDHSTVLHMCLAVLAAIGMLLAARALFAAPTSTATIWASRRFSRSHTASRAPPAPSGRRLAELCLLRR